MEISTDDLAHALVRAKSGDEAGFMALWRQLQPRLLRYLHVLNCTDVDDVASETWLQVVRDLPGFSGGDEDFRRWLFTVGRHRAIDDARARQRRPTVPMPDTMVAVLPDRDLVEDQVLRSFATRQAISLLRTLPRDQAEAVALRVLAGLDTPDVAGILGKSSGAVRIALHRGLRALAASPAIRALAPELAASGPAAAANVAGGSAAGNPGAGNPVVGNPTVGDTAAGNPVVGNPAVGDTAQVRKEVDRGQGPAERGSGAQPRYR
jgi:RNA polymerase sigma-70 factor (ECF subfamily)